MFRTILTALALAAVPTTALAQSVAYDGFNYTPGSTLNGLSGGFGWGNSWNSNSGSFTIAPNSLSNPQGTLTTSGNRLDMPATASFTTASRSLSTDLTTANGGSVWVSFTITRTGGATGGYGGIVIGNEDGSAADNTGRLFIGNPGGADNWALQRAGGGTTSLSNYVVSQVPTALLVAHIQFGRTGPPDAVQLYVNRAPGGPTPPSADASLSNLDINPSNGPVTDLGIWYSGYGYQIDEIRVGTSYADVTPVPEPASALAVAGAGLFTLFRRRGRNRR